MSSNDERVPAIVIGLDTMQGLQAARILAGHGIPVIAIARERSHHACRTRVCRRILFGETTSEELIGQLRALGPTLPDRAAIYPCHDHAVTLVSRNRDQLTDWYHVPMADPETIEMMMDKQRFYAFARQHGVPCPETRLLHDRDEAQLAARELQFPAILKPLRRNALWDRKTMAKAFRVEDAAALLELYDRVGGWAPVLMIQQWIEGTDSDLYSCNCYFDQRGELVTSFVARKLRQWPPRTGSSCLGEECRNDVVRDSALRLFRESGYKGLGYMEMKRDTRTGTHYAIEANVGRPTGRSAIAEAGGVEMLYAMYCDALGLPLPERLEQRYLGVKWIDLRHDFQSALHYFRNGELTLGQWYRSWRGRKAYAVFSWSDPLPFFADFWRAFTILFSPSKRAERSDTA